MPSFRMTIPATRAHPSRQACRPSKKKSATSRRRKDRIATVAYTRPRYSSHGEAVDSTSRSPPSPASQQPSEIVLGDPGVLQNLREQLGSDALAIVHREHERPPVLVNQEAVTSTATRLAEAGTLERGEN